MKFRTDFVTNSSSSSFTVIINFKLINGKTINFEGTGGSPEAGRIDYFDGEVYIDVSPRELGMAESVDELIALLNDGIKDSFEGCIFDKSNPREPDDVFCFEISGDKIPVYDAYDFIKKIKKEIKTVDDIAQISIEAQKFSLDEEFNRKYIYDKTTGSYTGVYEGENFYCDGDEGGEVRISDLDKCDIE